MADSSVTLITGGAGGIGAALADQLLARGRRVVVTGRDAARLADWARRTQDPGRVRTVVADPTDYEAVRGAVDVAVDGFGRLDHIVANAGFSTHDTLADGDPDQWREMLLVNVLGPMVLVKAALPALRATCGRIVLVGSVAGIKHSPGNVYSITKWAITGMSENVRLLVSGDGIGVTMVAPGRVDTAFWETNQHVAQPLTGPVLTGSDVATTIGWVLDQPIGVDVNTVVVRPVGQSG
jgi:NADP-dependent 3-hydroxy acid dehydrogenase YdfG